MPRAFVAAAACAFDALEALEDPRQLLGGDARARVAHRELERSPGARRLTPISPSNVNLNAFESRLRTIFSHMSLIDVSGLRQRRAVDDELETRRLDTPSGSCSRGPW